MPEIRQVTDLILQIVIEGTEDEANARQIDGMCEATINWLVESPYWQREFERLVALGTEIETSTEGEMRTVTATITFSLQYNYLFITRVPDLLHTMDVRVPVIPGGETAGPGTSEQEVHFVLPVESEVEDWPEEQGVQIDARQFRAHPG